jgi:DNA-binding transcriptional LysR family regulator
MGLFSSVARSSQAPFSERAGSFTFLRATSLAGNASKQVADAVVVGRHCYSSSYRRTRSIECDHQVIVLACPGHWQSVSASRAHPLAKRKRMTWDDLANERWVGPPPDTLLFDHVQRTLHKGELVIPRHVIQTMSLPMAFSMVLHGNFLCLGTYLHYEFTVFKPMLTILKVNLPRMTVAFGAVTLKDREQNPLGVRLAGLVAELAQAARDGHGA